MAPIKTHLAPWAAKSHTLIFFITGNPGLIGYYTTFFQTLRCLLADSSRSKDFQQKSSYTVYGESLAGFEEPLPRTRRVPYSLQEQIGHVHTVLDAQRVKPTPDAPPVRFNSVLLVGHSVGSYILLEVTRRVREARRTDTEGALNIRAGVLLFPTVTHIAQSDSGLVLTRLLSIPGFERVVHLIAKGAFAWMPRAWVRGLVGVVTGMPAEGAGITGGFLQSENGVWQALHLARDEMNTITEDKWDSDIWGIQSQRSPSGNKPPKLIFYFGQEDHWVADHTRDALIKSRGMGDNDIRSSAPTMLICEDGIPHGFCIKHSEIVAEKVAVWIDELALADG